MFSTAFKKLLGSKDGRVTILPPACKVGKDVTNNPKAWNIGNIQTARNNYFLHWNFCWQKFIAVVGRNLLFSDSSQKYIWEISFWYLLIKSRTKIWSLNIRRYLRLQHIFMSEARKKLWRPNFQCRKYFLIHFKFAKGVGTLFYQNFTCCRLKCLRGRFDKFHTFWKNTLSNIGHNRFVSQHDSFGKTSGARWKW